MSWTEARVKSFITSVLRGGFRKWPPKFAVLRSAKDGTMPSSKIKKEISAYKCAGCGGRFPFNMIQVDHIDPVVDLQKGFEGWDKYIERLYVGEEGLQVLCKECHKQKTSDERKVRCQTKTVKKTVKKPPVKKKPTSTTRSKSLKT